MDSTYSSLQPKKKIIIQYDRSKEVSYRVKQLKEQFISVHNYNYIGKYQMLEVIMVTAAKFSALKVCFRG